MKKKIFIIFCLIILIIGIVLIVKYNNKKNKLNYTVEQISEENYFLLLQDNKYGVINKSGDIVIDPIYDIIEIPNPSKDIFICKNNFNTDTKEYNIQVFNQNKEPILFQYYIVEAIQLNNVQDNGFYEKSVLKYKSDGLYGLIDFSGNKITEPIYESIEGFEYKEGLLIVKKSGKLGIININGASILKEKYDEILCDGYYTENLKYSDAGYIVGTRTDSGMRYGYINSKRKQLLKNEFNDIYRINSKTNENSTYIVAFKQGKAGVYENKKILINHDYEDIVYDEKNELLILQKFSKQGVSKINGEILVPIEYDNIFFTENYINAQKSDSVDLYNLNGKKEENPEYVGKQSFVDNKYEIVSTSNDEYKIINNEKGTVISNEYSYIQYLFNKYFLAQKNNLLGIIDCDGNVIIDFKYNAIQSIQGYNIIQILNEDGTIILLNENMKEILKEKNASILSVDNYIKVVTKTDIKYLDKTGNFVENTTVFKQNELISFKEKDKWGFKDKNGNIVVKPIYQMVTEFNKYGFAGIKTNEKWGVIDKNGNIIKEPVYEITENIDLSFIKEYYKIDLGYGEPYYTNQIKLEL